MERHLNYVCLLGFLPFLFGCSFLSNDDLKVSSRIVIRCPSPDKSKVAVFYILTGGGAAGWLDMYIDVQNKSSQINLGRSYYKIDDSHEKMSFEWLDSKSLNVISWRQDFLSSQRDSYNQVSVRQINIKQYQVIVNPDSCLYRSKK